MNIKYLICLSINIRQKENSGGFLIIGELNQYPNFVMGETILVKDYKVGYEDVENLKLTKLSFNFSMTLISIDKVIEGKEELQIRYLFESSDREEILKLTQAFRDRNPDFIKE